MFTLVWLITSACILIFTAHPQNPFAALTSSMPLTAMPFVVALYAFVPALICAIVPESDNEFLNLLVPTGLICVGGLFGPHLLTALAAAFF